jgi:hypothetical protein
MTELRNLLLNVKRMDEYRRKVGGRCISKEWTQQAMALKVCGKIGNGRQRNGRHISEAGTG